MATQKLKTKYYEAHVAIDPVIDAYKRQLIELAEAFKFKVADLLMSKDGYFVVSDHDMFMTGHSHDYELLNRNMIALVLALAEQGYKVRRYKMEAVIFDSRVRGAL